ncbi:hypothetical protein [Propioniciclava sp.]|nr:hypothetical protein [Propioniciclava sp.]
MVIHTDEHTMLALLACLHAQPGGVEGVLSRLGWTPSDQAALRAHLLS